MNATSSVQVMTRTWRRMGWSVRMFKGDRAILAQEDRVGDAGLAEAPGAQYAAIAPAARPPLRRRIVAAVGQPVVQTQLEPAPDDVRLAQHQQRRVHAEPGA